MARAHAPEEGAIQLLSARDVAARLKCSIPQVYTWARMRTLPSVKLGDKILRFLPADVQAFIEKRHRAAF